jgi:hypothetical protein
MHVTLAWLIETKAGVVFGREVKPPDNHVRSQTTPGPLP